MKTSLPEKPPQLVFLTGFMASGKSTLGKKAAGPAHFTFLDLDEIIEEREKMAVSEIFRQKGEPYFRARESETLKDLKSLPQGKYLIACGGGTPCHGDNLDWMKSHGTVLYLRHKPGLLAQRLTSGSTVRPLIRAMAPENRETTIRELIREREFWYMQADYVLQGNAISTKGLRDLLALF